MFHDVTLPKFISIFATGNPQFSSSIASTISGREVRILDQEYAKQRYIIKDCRLSVEEFEIFNAFFRARKGQSYSFRFRDHIDCSALRQTIRREDISHRSFQLTKLYEDLVSPYLRIITKPITDSVKVYLNNEIVIAEVDYITGIVTVDFDSEPQQLLQGRFYI
ncbi:MAG: TIGR02217 family protein [Rickettsiaceae bacterium]|nr:MAG: TIGR02217 family protein [Rickettsiaceae bacterium]